MKWQILIPTLDCRGRYLSRLMARLEPQIVPGVGYLVHKDGGEKSIGRKRQELLEESQAEYISFVDDDDLVSPDYCQRILTVLGDPEPPDIVGFRLRYFLNGKLTGLAIHSYNAPDLPNPVGYMRQERRPNHLNPVRRELALRVGFKPLNYGEDADYSRRLAVLKPREHFIDAPLYDYLFRVSRAGERTNDRVTLAQGIFVEA